MSDTPNTDATLEPKRLGLLAQFAGPDELIAAAEKTTDAGYQKVEAYSPFAVIGIDEALKQKGTILPWVVFCMGLSGLFIAVGMQFYMNGAFGSERLVPWLAGYDFQISGKPPGESLPAFIPVTFEVIVLLSAFGSFFGMLILNQLPKLFNPLFRNERFADVTTDGFFLFVDAGDGKYAETETEAFLTSVGATGVDAIDDVPTGHAVPGMLYMVGAVAGCVALLPPLYIWMTATTTSTVPRISFFKDMESQAKQKAQTTTTLFEDGRAARKPIEGTVARGSGKDDMRLYYGVEPEANLAGLFELGGTHFASYRGDSSRVPARFAAEGGEVEVPAEPEAAADAPPEEEEKNWSTEFPESLVLDEAFMARGEQKYNIQCAACHGLAGNGDGLVSTRALSLNQGTWVTPSSLHIEAVTTQPVGRIFETISYGRRKMPGYAQQISPEDRWAIVLYIKALQRSQAASEADVPPAELEKIKNLNK